MRGCDLSFYECDSHTREGKTEPRVLRGLIAMFRLSYAGATAAFQATYRGMTRARRGLAPAAHGG